MSDVIKKFGVTQKLLLDESELEKINSYTLRDMAADEVFAFSVIMCNNDIDRDFEAFSQKALQKLAELFVGKPVIEAHNRQGRQCARIYSTQIVQDRGRISATGESFTALTARCYTLRVGNEKMIAEIESGILKEVSVSCQIGKRCCSVCGNDTCTHLRGETYGGKLCYKWLEEPTDAYELSFVTVPAQIGAGTVKTYTQADTVLQIDKETQALINSVNTLIKTTMGVMN